MTPLTRHIERWKDCRRCSLWKGRQRVVLCGGGPYPLRGSVPADVLLVGEAPGDSEDMLGLPMVGPAGYLLARIMKESGLTRLRYCITNILGCFPKDVKANKDSIRSELPSEVITACRPRLVELARIVKPRLVVTIGKLAEQCHPFGGSFDGSEWLPNGRPLMLISIVHPSAILRADVSRQEFMILRTVVTLKDALVGLSLAQ